MRPIFWGLIIFAVSAIGWVVSVVLAVITLGSLKLFANLFGIIFILSLPTALIAELIRWWIRRKK